MKQILYGIERNISWIYIQIHNDLAKTVKITDYIFENYIFLFQFSNWMHFLNISRTLFNYIFTTLIILPYFNHIGLWYYSYFLHFIVSFWSSIFSFFLSFYFILLFVRWTCTKIEKLYLCLIQKLKYNCKRTATYDKIFNI